MEEYELEDEATTVPDEEEEGHGACPHSRQCPWLRADGWLEAGRKQPVERKPDRRGRVREAAAGATDAGGGAHARVWQRRNQPCRHGCWRCGCGGATRSWRRGRAVAAADVERNT